MPELIVEALEKLLMGWFRKLHLNILSLLGVLQGFYWLLLIVNIFWGGGGLTKNLLLQIRTRMWVHPDL